MEVHQDQAVVELGLQEKHYSTAIQPSVPVAPIPLGHKASHDSLLFTRSPGEYHCYVIRTSRSISVLVGSLSIRNNIHEKQMYIKQ